MYSLTLTIIPSSEYAIIPFESLLNNEGKYLIEDFDIQYAHSLNIRYLQKNHINRNQPKEACIIANPNYKNPKGTLRNFNQEIINFMVKFQNPIPITDQQVSKKFIKKKFSNLNQYYSIVQFYTHGKGYLDYPELSLLHLSDTSTNDPYLLAKEIKELHFKSDLVILAACETALSKSFRLEGSDGLKEAFIIAGAKGVIATLWEVEDDTAYEVTNYLHRQIAYDRNIVKALSEIKRKFIHHNDRRKQHPAFWAAYQYYGLST